MQGHWHILQILSAVTIFPMLFLSCGRDRVNIEFKTSRQIYLDDAETDPDKLNKELEYDLREAEKKRRQKQREAEAAAKAKEEAERKTEPEQKVQEQDETAQSQEAKQSTP